MSSIRLQQSHSLVYIGMLLLDRSLCLIHVYWRNSSVLYPDFVEEISDPLRKVKANESTIFSVGLQ